MTSDTADAMHLLCCGNKCLHADLCMIMYAGAPQDVRRGDYASEHLHMHICMHAWHMCPARAAHPHDKVQLFHCGAETVDRSCRNYHGCKQETQQQLLQNLFGNSSSFHTRSHTLQRRHCKHALPDTTG